MRILGALETRLGPRKAVSFLDPAFLLTAAEARGRGTWAALPGLQASDVKSLEGLFEAEGMRLEAVPAAKGLTLNVRSLKGYATVVRRSKLPGLAPYPVPATWAAHEIWEKQCLESLREAQKKGQYPPLYQVEHLLNGVAYGYPDLACLDFQAVKFEAGAKGPAHPLTTTPNIPYVGAFGRESVGFIVLQEHQRHPDITGVTEEWGKLLKALAQEPWVSSLCQDPLILQNLGLLAYPVDGPCGVLTARQTCWSYQPRFEENRVGPGPLTARPPEAARAVELVGKILPLNPKYAAMLSEPEAALGLAGWRGLVDLTLFAPNETDLRDLDRVNEVLLGEGMSLRPSLDFGQSGLLWLVNLSAGQTLSREALGKVDDPTYRVYECQQGWMGFEDWCRTLTPGGGMPSLDRLKVLRGLPPKFCHPQERIVEVLALPTYPLYLPVPEGEALSPEIGVWMTRTEEALRQIYAVPVWTQLLANPYLRQARLDRFQGLKRQRAEFEQKRAAYERDLKN